jgi:hypothetical protein
LAAWLNKGELGASAVAMTWRGMVVLLDWRRRR